MDHRGASGGDDDDDGVGYIQQSHYLKSSPSDIQHQAMALLQLPHRDAREGSISSNVSDLEVPIYSSENLTRRTRKPEPDGGLTGKLAFAIVAAAVGSSFQHGYNTGVINNPQKILESWMTDVITNRTGTVPEQETITILWSIAVSIFCVGGMIGGAITGFVADTFGRKGGLLLNNILVLLTVLAEGFSKMASSYEMLILGRFLIGINSGLNAGLAPMYLSEISPMNLRGAVGTVYQLVITISILISQILSLKEVLGTSNNWPVLFVMTAVPAAFQMLTLPFCPESPKHLLAKGNEVKAQKALAWFRGTLAVNDEIDAMKAENDAAKLLPKVTVRELITNSALRIPLIIALTVMVAQQLSGINAVMFFSTKIFELAGLKGNDATYATLGMGTINVAMTIISLILVEKAGRKTLLLIGFAGMTVATSLLTIFIYLQHLGRAISICCIIFVLVYVIMFATGPGSIPWFLVSELFNQSARPTAASLAVCINWTANFIVGLSFLPLESVMHASVFVIFVVLDLLFCLFIWKKVPETKNKSIEEISAMFRQQSYQ